VVTSKKLATILVILATIFTIFAKPIQLNCGTSFFSQATFFFILPYDSFVQHFFLSLANVFLCMTTPFYRKGLLITMPRGHKTRPCAFNNHGTPPSPKTAYHFPFLNLSNNLFFGAQGNPCSFFSAGCRSCTVQALVQGACQPPQTGPSHLVFVSV